jgi:uncharacterized protein
MSISRRITASVTLVLLLCIALPALRRALVPDRAWASWIGPVVFLALPLIALGRASWSELGLDRVHRRGVAVALGGSLIMVAAFVAAGARPGLPAARDLAQGTVLAALAEEILFRGYALRQLHERGGWPFAAALLFTAALFGLGHLSGAVAAGEGGNAIATVLITAAGGAWFGWIFARWEYCLWVPIAMHAAMNTWWLVFSAGPTAGAGGAAALWGRVGAITLVTVLTLRWTAARKAAPAGA